MNFNKYVMTIFHTSMVVLLLSSVNSLLHDIYGYFTIPFINLQMQNHSINFLLITIFFYLSYYNLSHLSFGKRVIFAGVISMFANIFYDMLWNMFYLNAVELPFYNMLNFISLAGIVGVLTYTLYRLNKDFSIFIISKKRILQLTACLFIVVALLTSLFWSGYFRDYFSYITLGTVDPHNFTWMVSRIASFAMWIPILRWKND